MPTGNSTRASTEADFLHVLERAGRRRVTLENLWKAADAVLGRSGGEDRRWQLHRLLTHAARGGTLTLPGNAAAGWDRAAVPALPPYVMLSSVASVPRAPDVPPNHPWHPLLACLADTALTIGAREWLRLDAWLKKGGRNTLPPVPLRERSWEIFGDEKALDGVLMRKPFREGALNAFSLLRAFPTPEPFAPVVCSAAHGRPLLVTENAAPFASLANWNGSAARWSAVVYGRGNSFSTASVGLPLLCALHGTSTVEYAGDIDGNGLRIPVSQVSSLASVGIRLSPCIFLYEAMLETFSSAEFSPLPAGPWSAECASGWLSESLFERVSVVALEGRRIPQECLGTAWLDTRISAEPALASLALGTHRGAR